MKKRGVSPVIATVLLVAMIIVVGLIVFLWFSGMTEEAITKFDGTNIKLVCEGVQFNAEYASGTLNIVNIGNVPIFKMQVKLSGEGSHETKELGGGWPDLGLNQGGTFSGSFDASGAETLTLIPVLRGESKKGEKNFVCEERFGHEISIE